MAFTSAERWWGRESTVPAVLSVLSLGAAAIHFAVIGEHFDESWLFGAFFLVTAWVQAAWAVLVVTRASRPLLVVGAIVNAAIVVIWLWSRTTGLPIGPEPGEPEAASFIDVVPTVAEALLVAGCIGLLRSRNLRVGLSSTARASVFFVTAALTVGTTSWALATSAGEGHHHAGTHEQVGHEHH